MELWFRTLMAGIFIGIAFVVAGCNTVHGVGKDLGAAGDAISDTSQKTKEKMTR